MYMKVYKYKVFKYAFILPCDQFFKQNLKQNFHLQHQKILRMTTHLIPGSQLKRFVFRKLDPNLLNMTKIDFFFGKFYGFVNAICSVCC